MTNPDNAIGTNAAYSGRTSVKAFNDVLSAFTPGIVSGWNCQVDSGLTVNLGGSGYIRDVAIAVDNAGNKTSINNINAGTEVAVTLDSAPASDSRIDAIVAYVDNPPQGVATTADNPGTCGIIPVSGTVSADPQAPDENAIRTAITLDGASGTTAYYVVLATVEVPTGTTDLIPGYITQGDQAVLTTLSSAANITMTTVDPGEGVDLAPNEFIGVYSTVPEDPLNFDYSLAEINTGTKWIDGKTIYKKTIDFGALPNTSSKSVAHNISNLGYVIKIEGYAWDETSSYRPLPSAAPTAANSIEVYNNDTNIVVYTGINRSNLTTCYITLYYTKTS